jgi:hypothetical protein
MKKIIVKYGSENHAMTIKQSATIAEITADSTARAVLGYGDNVKALVHGVEQPSDAIPADGTTVTLETKLNQKAH